MKAEVIADTQKVKAKLSLSSGGVGENTQPLDHDNVDFVDKYTLDVGNVEDSINILFKKW